MDWPKLLYREGEGADHMHWGEPLLIQGKHKLDTMTVHTEAEEEAALADGWRGTVEADAPDAPRRGRPPKEAD